MGKGQRIDLMIERHIGLGIRWTTKWTYAFELSISILCFTFIFGFGDKQ
jgi:hypothetical protein